MPSPDRREQIGAGLQGVTHEYGGRVRLGYKNISQQVRDDIEWLIAEIDRLRVELKNSVPYRPGPGVAHLLPYEECYDLNPCLVCRLHYGIKLQSGGA